MIEIILYVVGGLIGLAVLTFLYMLYRTTRLVPNEPNFGKFEPLNLDFDRAVEYLQKMLRVPTVSDANQVDYSKFKEFRELLLELFPNIAKKCPYKRLDKTAFLIYWKAADSEGPENPFINDNKPNKSKNNSDNNKPKHGPVVFISHYDVVAADDAPKWKHPPFSGDIADGEVWGRGALDTKCTTLGILFAVDSAIAEGRRPNRDIYIAISGDEEIVGPGAPAIVAYMKEHDIHPDFCVDEGGAVLGGIPSTNKQFAFFGIAEKGQTQIRITAKGSGGHASAPPNHSAVGVIGKAISVAENNKFPSKFGRIPMLTAKLMGRYMPFFPRFFFANTWFFGEPLSLIFTHELQGELPALFQTTMAWTMVSGSGEPNVLPVKATATVDIRLIPGDTPESAKKRLDDLLTPLGVTTEIIKGRPPSPISNVDNEQWRNIQRAVHGVWGEDTVACPYLFFGGADAYYYSYICPNTYRFTPVHMDRAHRGLLHNTNERIPIECVHQCVSFYYRLLEVYTDK